MAYNTKQKNIILECLAADREASLAAKDILAICEHKGTPVGLATIYRQLDSLVQEQKAKKIITDDYSGIRFQYLSEENCKDAFCLKCDCCGKITPADCGFLAEISDHMSEKHGFSINSSRSVLYGRCKECK